MGFKKSQQLALIFSEGLNDYFNLTAWLKEKNQESNNDVMFPTFTKIYWTDFNETCEAFPCALLCSTRFRYQDVFFHYNRELSEKGRVLSWHGYAKVNVTTKTKTAGNNGCHAPGATIWRISGRQFVGVGFSIGSTRSEPRHCRYQK